MKTSISGCTPFVVELLLNFHAISVISFSMFYEIMSILTFVLLSSPLIYSIRALLTNATLSSSYFDFTLKKYLNTFKFFLGVRFP